MSKDIYVHLFLHNYDPQSIREAIKELNQQQDVLCFKDTGKNVKAKESKYELNDLYMNITLPLKDENNLPNLITITDVEIYSKASDNSSIGTHLTRSYQIGFVVLKSQLTNHYLKYELLRTSLQLAINKYMSHAPERCLFDRKIRINNTRLCSHCREQVQILGVSGADIKSLGKALKTIKNESLGIMKSNWYSVIIMDIVGYSKLTDTEQKTMIEKLQKIVKNNEMIADNEENILFLPTGDGCVIAIEGDLQQLLIRICTDLQKKMKEADIEVRFGLNIGTVFTYQDINSKENIAGGGINMAARAMDVGDANHIIANRTVYDAFGNRDAWHRKVFHDLKDVKVKHGVDLHVYNVFSEEEGFGNPEKPERMREDHD